MLCVFFLLNVLFCSNEYYQYTCEPEPIPIFQVQYPFDQQLTQSQQHICQAQCSSTDDAQSPHDSFFPEVQPCEPIPIPFNDITWQTETAPITQHINMNIPSIPYFEAQPSLYISPCGNISHHAIWSNHMGVSQECLQYTDGRISPSTPSISDAQSSWESTPSGDTSWNSTWPAIDPRLSAANGEITPPSATPTISKGPSSWESTPSSDMSRNVMWPKQMSRYGVFQEYNRKGLSPTASTRASSMSAPSAPILSKFGNDRVKSPGRRQKSPWAKNVFARSCNKQDSRSDAIPPSRPSGQKVQSSSDLKSPEKDDSQLSETDQVRKRIWDLRRFLNGDATELETQDQLKWPEVGEEESLRKIHWTKIHAEELKQKINTFQEASSLDEMQDLLGWPRSLKEMDMTKIRAEDLKQWIATLEILIKNNTIVTKRQIGKREGNCLTHNDMVNLKNKMKYIEELKRDSEKRYMWKEELKGLEWRLQDNLKYPGYSLEENEEEIECARVELKRLEDLVSKQRDIVSDLEQDNAILRGLKRTEVSKTLPKEKK